MITLKIVSSDRKNFITLLVMYLVPLAGMGVDIYTPSLPSLVHYFAIEPSAVKITLGAYLLGYGAGQPFFGTASDTLGRKKPLLLGLFLFLITSVLCPFSPNITTLICLRFFQGIFIAAVGSITKTILSDSFAGKELSIKFTYMSMAWGIGPIVAPAIGGYLEYYFDWKASFYFITVYGLLGFLLAWFFFKESNSSPIPWHFKNTLKAYKEMFSHKLFISIIFCQSSIYGLILLFDIIGPFVIQVLLKQSPIAFGHIAFIMGFAYFLGGIANRFLLKKMEPSAILPVGIGIMLIASIALVIVAYTLEINQWALTIPSFFTILGGGIIFPNLIAKALSLFPGRGGTSSALMGSLFVVGTSIISSIGSFLKTQTLEPYAVIYFALVALILWIHMIAFRRKFG